MSPNLSRALQNQDLRGATYTLPDGTIVDPRQPVQCFFFCLRCVQLLHMIVLKGEQTVRQQKKQH